MIKNDKINVLLLGNGGREHAIAWKLRQSPYIAELFIAPGNAGTSLIGTNIDNSLTDPDTLVEYAKENNIGLTVVGPEAPLALGVVNVFRKAKLPIFGPTKEAALLETSKSYAKEVMVASGVSTAEYEVFTDYSMAETAIPNWDLPLVIKVDGLAAGTGVIICNTKEHALETVADIFLNEKFGTAGQKVVMEEFLVGQEISAFAFVDGTNVSSIAGATDYKRAYEGDNGPNTGGMGSYSPPHVWTKTIESSIRKAVFNPVVSYMKRKGNPYTGVLYAGLIVTDSGIKVLEFNCRFGDPETQVLLPRMKTDLLQIMIDTAMEDITKIEIEWDPRPCVGVVLASQGYPGSYETNKQICGLDELDSGVNLFHAGTSISDDSIVTNGGRVLAVTALGDSFSSARDLIYKNINKIKFDGVFYRNDIAAGI